MCVKIYVKKEQRNNNRKKNLNFNDETIRLERAFRFFAEEPKDASVCSTPCRIFTLAPRWRLNCLNDQRASFNAFLYD
jgi:hypothetical protein